MKRRNLLIVMVLAMTFLVLSSFSFKANTVQASVCTNFCLHEYNNCMIDCNGAPSCQQFCRDEYYCCLKACNNESCW
jgi:hypothetical protein